MKPTYKQTPKKTKATGPFEPRKISRQGSTSSTTPPLPLLASRRPSTSSTTQVISTQDSTNPYSYELNFAAVEIVNDIVNDSDIDCHYGSDIGSVGSELVGDPNSPQKLLIFSPSTIGSEVEFDDVAPSMVNENDLPSAPRFLPFVPQEKRSSASRPDPTPLLPRDRKAAQAFKP